METQGRVVPLPVPGVNGDNFVLSLHAVFQELLFFFNGVTLYPVYTNNNNKNMGPEILIVVMKT